jgi:MFS family permease
MIDRIFFHPANAFFHRIFSGSIWMFVFAHLSHHVITALVVPLLPFIRSDFKLDYTQSGFVVSAFSLSYGLAQLPAGWLADRIGPHKLITLSISGVAFAGLLLGLSHRYLWVIIFLILMGLAGGGYHPAAPPLISASVSPEKRGFALGWHVVGGSSSYFLSPLIGAFIAGYLGWRGAFISLAVPVMLFGLFFHAVLRRRMNPAAHSGRSRKGGGAALAPGYSFRPVIAFIFLSTFTSAVLSSTISFIPLFMVDAFQVPEKTAAFFVAIIYSSGLWAGPLGGSLSDRMGRIPVILTICFSTGPAVYLMNHVPYGIGFGLLLLLMGAILYVRMPVSEAYIVGEVPERFRSTILGIYFFCSIEGGGALTPVMGALVDRFGFHTAFTAAASSVMLSTFVGSFFLKAGSKPIPGNR